MSPGRLDQKLVKTIEMKPGFIYGGTIVGEFQVDDNGNVYHCDCLGNIKQVNPHPDCLWTVREIRDDDYFIVSNRVLAKRILKALS